jgi:Flp pilus assembly protein TadD
MIYATRLSEVYPDSIYGHLYRGQVGIQTGRLDQALEDMNRVLALAPENISARNLRGYIFLLRKEYEALQKEISGITSRGGELLEVLRPYSGGNEK